MTDFEKLESQVQYAADMGGRVARALHKTLARIGYLEREIEMRDALIAELKMALRATQVKS